MLYQELPRIESTRLDGWARWLAPVVIVAAALTIASLLLLVGQSFVAAAAVLGGLTAAAFVYRRSPPALAPNAPLVVGPDYSLVGSALGLSREPTALTTSEGSLLIVNSAYRERFGGTRPPLDLASDDQARQGLQLAKSMAWRDGAGCVAGIATDAGTSPVEVERVGSRGDLLLWRFPDPSPPDPLTSAVKRVQGAVGERLAKAGVLSAVVDAKGTPVYPGDLVVKEDKAAVADAVRRNARGPAMSGDLAVRLARHTGEPVALTIAGLRGLGDAAVLLLLKDNSEEAKLKRQVMQATKMQVVGQLAGGVAHDFNNILTAIIGHCDLMLMRHTPGDSDYDDIQQIKSNSNRAAGLTRQLLAFSRQQTLRPQVLQLPDVVSEVSHLLKRLLGETVELVVKHGRSLGPVRADPGQLEQVIINLAVNARDAMQSKGGGALTIQTYSVRADQVAELGSDILPVADYSALSVADTGTGISPNVLGKIFEPFFTTKEVGKGTGLGLSTVYGIVKQSGGFIFADSKVGEGTRFVIYLPVHRVEPEAGKAAKTAKPKENELWGSGTVLLVEDEPMVRTVAERALTRHGYSVITADNGEDALEVLERGEQIDLLISDVVMHGMD